METFDMKQLSQIFQTFMHSSDSSQAKYLVSKYDMDQIFIEAVEQMLKHVKTVDFTCNDNCQQLCKIVENFPMNLIQKHNLYTLLQEIDKETITDLPLNVLWWFDKLELLNLEMCYYSSDHVVITKQIIMLMEIQSDISPEQLYHPRNIGLHYLLHLLEISYCPRIKSKYLHRNMYWVEHCRNALQDFIKDVTEKCYKEINKDLYDLIKNLNEQKTFNAILIRQFFVALMNEMLTHNPEVDLYSAYTFQELWVTRHLDKFLVNMFKELLSKCSLNELKALLSKTPESEINWKYVMVFISCFISKVPNSSSQLQDLVNVHVKDAFAKQNSQKLIIAILFIRQEALERNCWSAYGLWYSNTFGINSAFVTSTKSKSFTFLMTVLSMLVPYEPEAGLMVHIDKSLRAPYGCQSLIIACKQTMKVRKNELEQTPHVFLLHNMVKVRLLHALEHVNKFQQITFPMKHVCRNHSQLADIVVPFLKSQSTYQKIYAMLDEVIQ